MSSWTALELMMRPTSLAVAWFVFSVSVLKSGAVRAAEVLLEFPLFLDGQERSILVYEGQAVRPTVASFLQHHHVALSHLDTVTREVRRKLAEDPSLSHRVMEEDKIQVANIVVDVGGGRSEQATFVLDGREEVQVLEWCNNRDLGPACVSGILKGMAQRIRQEQMNKQAAAALAEMEDSSSSPTLPSVEGQAMLVVSVMVDDQPLKMIGFEGQTVAQVVDSFLAANPQIPPSYKEVLMNEAVDSLLGVTVRKTPVTINLRPTTHQEQKQRSEAQTATAETTLPPTGTLSTPRMTDADKMYRIELYVNHELRPLLIGRDEDVEAKARAWCLEQGTRDPEHVRYVVDVIRQTIREQDIREELAPFQDWIQVPLISLLAHDEARRQQSDEEVLRFNVSDSHPEVVIRRQHLMDDPPATALTVAQAWCEANDIRVSEVSLVALMVVQHIDQATGATRKDFQQKQDAGKEGGVEPKEGAGWPHLGIPLVAALGTLGASLLLHKFLMGEHDEPRLEKS